MYCLCRMVSFRIPIKWSAEPETHFSCLYNKFSNEERFFVIRKQEGEKIMLTEKFEEILHQFFINVCFSRKWHNLSNFPLQPFVIKYKQLLCLINHFTTLWQRIHKQNI